MKLSDMMPDDDLARMKQTITSVAENFSVRISIPDRVPNSRKAIAASEYARVNSKLFEFKKALMDAYWLEGRNIEDLRIIGEAAAKAGLDLQKTADAAVSVKYLEIAEANREKATKEKVYSIPAFIFGDEIIEGCLPYEEFAEEAEAFGLEKRNC